MQQRRVETQNTPSRDLRSNDPVVEVRISRLLQRMRQNAISSGEVSPSRFILSYMAKAKKDEAEIDENERLLASEEGKKLSSKEHPRCLVARV